MVCESWSSWSSIKKASFSASEKASAIVDVGRVVFAFARALEVCSSVKAASSSASDCCVGAVEDMVKLWREGGCGNRGGGELVDIELKLRRMMQTRDTGRA